MVVQAVRARGTATTKPFEQPVSTLLYQLANRVKAQCAHHVPHIVRHIVGGGIARDVQLQAALVYSLDRVHQASLADDDFQRACGMGVIVTAEQIEDAVGDQLRTTSQCRYRYCKQ
jgi:glutaminyl-tRNA synthetase